MISAREALSSIEQGLQGLRRDEDRLVSMLASAEAEGERVRATQAEGFRALARLRLDAIARDETVGRLRGAEERVREALSRRSGRLQDTARRRSELTAATDAAEDRRAAAATARDAAVDAVEALVERVEAALKGDPAWSAADARVAEATAKAAAASAKAAQAAEDRDRKKVPYEADPLFMYLWAAGYGTSAYRAGPITRFFDARVARLVGYDRARVDFHMLNEIPLRLGEHAARLATDVDEAVAAREAIERAAAVAAGVEPLEDAVEAREDDLGAATAALEKARAEIAALDAETRDLVDAADDPGIRSALDELAAALAREDLRSLYRAALDTPTPEDETIVKSLQQAERDLVRIAAQTEELRTAAVDLAKRRTELERSETNFRKAGYDDPFGEFVNGAVIGGIIEGIIRGAMSSRNLDDILGKEYRRRAPRGGGFGGGFGGSTGRSGGSIRIGGSSRPSGRSGGGGFRTGGSF